MVKRKKSELTIRKKVLNNKSRKGNYYYIKEKNKRPAYYKIKEGVSIDNYLLAYRGKVKIKKLGVIKYTQESPAEKYLKTVSKRRDIDSLIKKGITESEFDSAKVQSVHEIHKAYLQMLSPLVKDKELIKILALEENVNKFKHRIQALISIKSKDEKMEITFKTFNKSLREVNNDLKTIMNKKELTEEDIQNLMAKKYAMVGLPKGVDITGYGHKVLSPNIGKINIKLRFVKAK